MYRVIMKIGYCKTSFDFKYAQDASKFMETAVDANVYIENEDNVEISMKYVKEGE